MVLKLRASGLAKYYGAVRALEVARLSLESRILAIVGPNGSGKTTFLAIAAGLKYPTRGFLEVNGFIPYRERERAVREIAFLFDRPRLPLSVRVRDVIKMVRELGDSDGVDRFIDVMSVKGFMDRKLSSLSMGEAQLVGLMVVLNMGSRLVILDEPFAHLDVRRASLLAELLRGWVTRGGGRACIYTTHSPWEAESLADHLVVLEDGRLRWWGSVEDLLKGRLFEVYVKPGRSLHEPLVEESAVKVLSCFGHICLVETEDLAALERLYEAGVIFGFKRAGVRGLYAK